MAALFKRIGWRIPIGLILLLVVCARPQKEPVLIQVGDRPVTVQEFRLALEFSPQSFPAPVVDRFLKAYADGWVTKLLIVEKARRLGWHRDPRVQARLKWIEKEAIRRALHREVAQKNVTVSERELREAFRKSQETIRVRHIFVRTEEEAWEVLRQLQEGIPFEQIAQEKFRDPQLRKSGGDLGYFTWGELDEDFERVAFSLKVGEISPPVRTRWGYHIIQVLDRKRRIFVTEEDFQKKRSALENVLRRRKEDRLAHEFVTTLMKGKDVRVNGRTAELLVRFGKKVSPRPSGDLLPPWKPPLLDSELKALQDTLAKHTQDVLVTFRGGQWTIRDFLELLRTIPPGYRPRLDDLSRFRRDLARIIRDEFLAQEGYRRGLHRRKEVRQEVRHWEENLLCYKFGREFLEGITVSEEEVRNFYDQHLDLYTDPPRVKLEQFVFARESQAREFVRQFWEYPDLSSVPGLIKRQVVGYVPYSVLGDIGRKAQWVEVGEVAGPFRIGKQYLVFQVLDKKPPAILPFEKITSLVRDDCLQNKRQRLLDSLLADVRAETLVQVDQALLEKEIERVKKEKLIPFVALPRRF